MEQLDADLGGRSISRDICALAGDLVFATDARGRIELAIVQDGVWLGHTAEALNGRALASLLPSAEAVPPHDVRLAPVRFRASDGSWQHCLLSLRSRIEGGRVGCCLLAVEEAGESAGDDEQPIRQSLDRVLARMHDEVLAPRAIGTALDELTLSLIHI